MTKRHSQKYRILAIAPSSRGFGFALLDRDSALADWGFKRILRADNTKCVALVEQLVIRYGPDVLALQDYWARDSMRAPRIRDLGCDLIALAKEHDIKPTLHPRTHVYRAVLKANKGTRRAAAEALAKAFPEQLGFRLPPKRRLWMSEDSRMYIFDAVGLVISARRTRNWRGVEAM